MHIKAGLTYWNNNRNISSANISKSDIPHALEKNTYMHWTAVHSIEAELFSFTDLNRLVFCFPCNSSMGFGFCNKRRDNDSHKELPVT